MTIHPTYECDYCENTVTVRDDEDLDGWVQLGRSIKVMIPDNGTWKSAVDYGPGDNDTFHYCCADCAEKHMAILLDRALREAFVGGDDNGRGEDH